MPQIVEPPLSPQLSDYEESGGESEGSSLPQDAADAMAIDEEFLAAAEAAEPTEAVEGGDESAPMPAAPVAATPIAFG